MHTHLAEGIKAECEFHQDCVVKHESSMHAQTALQTCSVNPLNFANWNKRPNVLDKTIMNFN